MTVQELRDLLATVEPTRLIVLARDEEGNHYSPLYDTITGTYVEEGEGGTGEVYFDRTPQERAKLVAEGLSLLLYDGEDGQPAFVLYPSV